MILFFDTETTCLPDMLAPSDAPHQPHLVQLAALLMEEDGTERGSMSVIIRPDGYEIPEGAAKVHGITTEISSRCGIPLADALAPFIGMAGQARQHVAHNYPFDQKIMRVAMLRAAYERRHIEGRERPSFCTMKAATHIVNLPPTERMLAAGINRPKSPSLAECYRHFFGEELSGAHDAMVDVRACARVYFELKRLEITNV